MTDPANLPAAQSKCTILQRIRNAWSAASRAKLITIASFVIVVSTVWANPPVCGRVFDLMNKVVDLTAQFHLVYGDLKIDFIARPGSSEPEQKHAGNRDP